MPMRQGCGYTGLRPQRRAPPSRWAAPDEVGHRNQSRANQEEGRWEAHLSRVVKQQHAEREESERERRRERIARPKLDE